MKFTPQLLLIKRTTLNLFVILLGVFFILGSGGTPVITILGDNPATVQQGSVYIDAGATAKDDDGPREVSVSGLPVDTSVLGGHTVTYSVESAEGGLVTAERIVNVIAVVTDTTPPVITILGDNPAIVQQGATYTDAGATAVDDVDGNVTVTTSGTVNTSTAGTYTITYTASDSKGNEATATREVKVIAVDTTPPVISILGDNPATVQQGATYTDAGATAVDDVDGNVTVTTSGTVDTSTAGTYTITYTASDSKGNKTSMKRTVVVSTKDTDDEFSRTEYKGLQFYYEDLPSTDYKLTQLSDSTFNALSESNKLMVADKLLATFFYGYPLKELKEKIDAGNFITSIRAGFKEDKTNREWLENHILDEDVFLYDGRDAAMAAKIFARFYSMKALDSYYLKHWTAYTLTQTILFSPAYELFSPNIHNATRVYRRLVTMLDVDSGMRYISYTHMMSEDNWRRFRSPRNNGGEMLHLFTLDTKDSDMYLAAQALKNWKLDQEDGDTLVVGLNDNTKPISLFGTIIYNGDDFYRELVKSDGFTKGVTRRIVDFFFTDATDVKKVELTNTIVSSKPETWQDILLQIVFSEEYLLNTPRTKSAEELFFSMGRKMYYKTDKETLLQFADELFDMGQAPMKYKYGKHKRVPLDSLSYWNYHRYIRDFMSRDMGGEFLADSNYVRDANDAEASLVSFVGYLFNVTIARDPKENEMDFLKNYMLEEQNGKKVLKQGFDFVIPGTDVDEAQREYTKSSIAKIVLDYISRLKETYIFQKVK